MPRIVQFATTSRQGEKDREGTDEKSVTFTVVLDAPAEMEWIERHPRTPKPYAPAEQFPGYYWDKVKPRQIAKLKWEIDCTATPWKFTEEPDSPLAAPAEISVTSELTSEPTLTDAKGRLICTTAGELLPGTTRERPLLVYNVSKALGSDPAWLDDYPGAVNSDAVRLRGRVRKAGTLMLRRVSLGPYTTKNRVRFTACNFELHYDPAGWIKRILNAGTLKLVEFVNAEKKKAWRQERIRIGTPPANVDKAVPLDRKGQPLLAALDPKGETPIDPAAVVVLEFNVQPLLPFAGVLPLQ